MVNSIFIADQRYIFKNLKVRIYSYCTFDKRYKTRLLVYRFSAKQKISEKIRRNLVIGHLHVYPNSNPTKMIIDNQTLVHFYQLIEALSKKLDAKPY